MAEQVEGAVRENSETAQADHRSNRLYIRVTSAEKQALRELTLASGHFSVSAYMRERGLTSGITPTEANFLHWEWLGAVNRIGAELDDIAAHLTHGREPDEEMLLLVMQLHELAQDTWREVQAGSGSQARND